MGATLHPDLIAKLPALFAFTTIPQTLGGSPPPPTHCLQVLQTTPIARQRPLQPPRDSGHTSCFRPRLICCSNPEAPHPRTQSWLQTYLERESLSASGGRGAACSLGLAYLPLRFSLLAIMLQPHRKSKAAASRQLTGEVEVWTGGRVGRNLALRQHRCGLTRLRVLQAAGPPTLRSSF